MTLNGWQIKNIVIIKTVLKMNFFILNPLGFKKWGHSSEMQNDDLIHREGLKG